MRHRGLFWIIAFLSSLLLIHEIIGSVNKKRRDRVKNEPAGGTRTDIAEIRDSIVKSAELHVGVPYRFGGAQPGGFDCSGLIQHAYKQAGFFVPMGVKSQNTFFKRTGSPQKGDILFFRIKGTNLSHVGLYLGNNKFVHAPYEGKRVVYANMNDVYWKNRYAHAGTIF